MKNQLLATAILFFSTIHLYAQGIDDAIINSQTIYEGTSRSIAMGNATGAMGGDMTATCINPAGLGLYRANEITFSTGSQLTLNSCRYYGDLHTQGKVNMSIPNFGYVIAMECSNYRPLRYLQVGLGFTRTNDFNYKSKAKGMNPSSSLIDAYLQTINGIDELYEPETDVGSYLSDHFPYDIHPAWQTFLIDQFNDSQGIWYGSPIPQGNIYQDNTVTSHGRSEEWTLAVSANFKDKLFIGTSLGLNHLKRRYTRNYLETPRNPGHEDNYFTQWSFEEVLKDDAWGVNFKLGLIYAPAPWLRLGAAWHTNTLYSFEEVWYTTTNASLLENHKENDYQYYSPTLNERYQFRTPASYTGSIALILGQRGMITTDVEYMDYGKTKFSSNSYSYTDTNNEIKEVLKPTGNIRIGTEWRIRQFFFRGGAAYYGSPFGFGNRYGSIKKLGIGIGYETNGGAYWDFAYELGESTTGFTPYQYYVDGVNTVEDAIQHQWRNKVTATLKLKL